MPLILFATARGHWTWLRGAIERHCQFSRESRLHRAKKNEGSCTPSLGYYSAGGPSPLQNSLSVRQTGGLPPQSSVKLPFLVRAGEIVWENKGNDALTTNPVHELHVDNCGLSPDGIADAMEAAEADPPLVILLPESIAAQAAYAEALLPGSAPACHKHTRNPGRSEQGKP